MDLNATITTVYGTPIRGKDVVDLLKVEGSFRSAVYGLIEREVVKTKFQEYKIKYSDREYKQFLISRKVESGVPCARSMAKFCRLNGVTELLWEEHAKVLFYKEKVKEFVVTPVKIKDYFKQNKLCFSSLEVSRIVVKDKKTIDFIHNMCTQKGKHFATLAKKYSLDENTGKLGGSLGLIRRGTLPHDVEKELFSCKKGDICGPYNEAGLWTLYKIFSKKTPKLTKSLEEYISGIIFSDWLRSHVLEAKA
ncbi:peptidylprolyl isomerase [Maridesulfovibrio sp.]|uniref:peptidylprolyl isomerase n=1 Tax=Maridesulfovibrio sp. TaxID=2795000 RepID=UPI0029C9FB8C|nr:peptidylprolyl isomerase [Maridesulfovibrio sp.]